MIGKVIRVNIQKIVSEWSLICGRSWQITYILSTYEDLEFANYNQIQNLDISDANEDKNNKSQEWKILYASHPTFSQGKIHPSIYVAVRKIHKYSYLYRGPQSDFDNEPENNPIRFIELPLEKLPAAILVTPGTMLVTKSQVSKEKHVSILNTHVKQLLKLNPSVNSKR